MMSVGYFVCHLRDPKFPTCFPSFPSFCVCGMSQSGENVSGGKLVENPDLFLCNFSLGHGNYYWKQLNLATKMLLIPREEYFSAGKRSQSGEANVPCSLHPSIVPKRERNSLTCRNFHISPLSPDFPLFSLSLSLSLSLFLSLSLAL